MSRDSPEQRGLVTVLLALGLRRNATIGLGVGLLLAGGAYLYRVVYVGRAMDVGGDPWLYLPLAFVLASATAALVTVVLTLVAAIRAARNIDSGPA